MEWKFAEIRKEDTKVDPSHLEFFRSEALNDSVSALIREDIQNRLDAKRRKVEGPVRVRYWIGTSEAAVKRTSAAQWLKGLNKHINAEKSLEELNSEEIDLDRPMPYLLIEDFNTTGLRGDPMRTTDPISSEEIKDRNDFYWFIRNVGRTGKKAGDRGRWGLGKIVYPASSHIRSFFAYSVRENDLHESLIGRSVLAIHQAGGLEYQSEGYFADFRDPEFKYLAHPTSDASTIDLFKKTFSVKRDSSEPGLSLVIPFPDESITRESLIQSLIHHYFWEIIEGNLEVEVSSSDGKQYALSKENLQSFVSTWPRFSPEDKSIIRNRLDFCVQAESLKLSSGEGYFLLAKPTSYYQYSIEELFSSPEDFERAKSRYREGSISVFELPVLVKRKRGNDEGREASFLVYLQRDESLPRPDETFIRDGLTVIGEKHISDAGIRVLTLSQDPVLSEFLGDAENPAHTRWLTTTKHFKGKYHLGDSLLKYVKIAALRLSVSLGKVEDEILEDLLSDVFGIETPDEGKSTTPTAKRGKQPPSKGEGKTKPRYIETSRLKEGTGFRIYPAPNATGVPERIMVTMAYEVEGGNPYNDYHPADFNLMAERSEIQVFSSGCTVSFQSGNRATIEVHSNVFEATFKGYDPNRDLNLNVKASGLLAHDDSNQ